MHDFYPNPSREKPSFISISRVNEPEEFTPEDVANSARLAEDFVQLPMMMTLRNEVAIKMDAAFSHLVSFQMENNVNGGKQNIASSGPLR